MIRSFGLLSGLVLQVWILLLGVIAETEVYSHNLGHAARGRGVYDEGASTFRHVASMAWKMRSRGEVLGGLEPWMSHGD